VSEVGRNRKRTWKENARTSNCSRIKQEIIVNAFDKKKYKGSSLATRASFMARGDPARLLAWQDLICCSFTLPWISLGSAAREQGRRRKGNLPTPQELTCPWTSILNFICLNSPFCKMGLMAAVYFFCH
jgi:hypothetical protein